MPTPRSPAARNARERVPLRYLRLYRWAAQNGAKFRVFKEPYDKERPLRPVSKAKVVGDMDNPSWRVVYCSHSSVEFPSSDGRCNYTIELDALVGSGIVVRYVFEAPGFGELEKSLAAKRAQERLAKAQGQ